VVATDATCTAEMAPAAAPKPVAAPATATAAPSMLRFFRYCSKRRKYKFYFGQLQGLDSYLRIG